MKLDRRVDRPLSGEDIDPKLAKLALEKMSQVHSCIASGTEHSLGALRERRVAEQTAERNGQPSVISVQSHERSDSAIKSYLREDRRTRSGRLANFCGWNIGLLIFALIFGNIIVSGAGTAPPFRAEINAFLMLTIVAANYPIVRHRRRRRNPPLSILARVLPSVANTPEEQAYSAAVAEVAMAQDALGVEEARAMLVPLNSLMESERAVASQGEAIARAMQAQTLPELEAERDRLKSKLDAATDPVARQTHADNLRLYDDRLSRARNLAPIRERIEAQQESVRQTMASVQTSLASLSLASMDALAPATSGQPQAALLETTRDLQHRAASVEKAVQEVATLRIG